MNWSNSAIIPALIGLLLFGITFAVIVYRLDDRHHGYTALLVVIGVGITVVASGFVIGWQSVIYLFLAFAASGVPMIAGDIYRAIRHREQAERTWREILDRLAERGITSGGKNESSPPR